MVLDGDKSETKDIIAENNTSFRETRTTATLPPTANPRNLYSSSARTASSVGSATISPAASVPSGWGNALIGYKPFLRHADRKGADKPDRSVREARNTHR